ncbi:MAG TPA: HD domain-containing protein [Ktedonobacterales bacterium]|nr:HD domain-containing protein [Ktedonobacterales bacterium]
MDHASVLAEAEAFVKRQLAGDSSGHDWWHIARVRNLARTIAGQEGADGFVCELAALLHDVADDKIAGSEEAGLRTVREWLAAQAVDAETTEHAMEIIATMSFGGGNRPPMRTLEGRVVQDADRLDAIGALGIARAFAYGGSRGRALWDPDEAPKQYTGKADYRASGSSTINHFHEKLLLLKDRMNTAYGRRLAERRHAYMLAFLDEFAAEWEGAR